MKLPLIAGARPFFLKTGKTIDLKIM